MHVPCDVHLLGCSFVLSCWNPCLWIHVRQHCRRVVEHVVRVHTPHCQYVAIPFPWPCHTDQVWDDRGRPVYVHDDLRVLALWARHRQHCIHAYFNCATARTRVWCAPCAEAWVHGGWRAVPRYDCICRDLLRWCLRDSDDRMGMGQDASYKSLTTNNVSCAPSFGQVTLLKTWGCRSHEQHITTYDTTGHWATRDIPFHFIP